MKPLPVQPRWDPVKSTIRGERRKDASAPGLHPQGGIIGVKIIDPAVLQEGFSNHHLLDSTIATPPKCSSKRGVVISGA